MEVNKYLQNVIIFISNVTFFDYTNYLYGISRLSGNFLLVMSDICDIFGAAGLMKWVEEKVHLSDVFPTSSSRHP